MVHETPRMPAAQSFPIHPFKAKGIAEGAHLSIVADQAVLLLIPALVDAVAVMAAVKMQPPKPQGVDVGIVQMALHAAPFEQSQRRRPAVSVAAFLRQPLPLPHRQGLVSKAGPPDPQQWTGALLRRCLWL